MCLIHGWTSLMHLTTNNLFVSESYKLLSPLRRLTTIPSPLILVTLMFLFQFLSCDLLDRNGVAHKRWKSFSCLNVIAPICGALDVRAQSGCRAFPQIRDEKHDTRTRRRKFSIWYDSCKKQKCLLPLT